MKRVLLTGATGFIGRHCLPLLAGRGYEVHALSSRAREEADRISPEVFWHRCDLLSRQAIPRLMQQVRPSHLLHLAWYVAPGKWVTSGVDENLLWVQASIEILRSFCRSGGRRAVMAGSCAEYDWNYGYCSELRTPTRPGTFYGSCKHALHGLLDSYSAESGLSSAWGRIFFLYGPHEHPERLVASVVRSLLRGETARCSHGNQVRDYLHVHDVADAFIALLESDVEGAVNIASGDPVALREIVGRIAGILDREDLVRLGAIPPSVNDAPLVVADVSRLAGEVRWRPDYGLDRGLRQTIGWWQSELRCVESGTRK